MKSSEILEALTPSFLRGMWESHSTRAGDERNTGKEQSAEFYDRRFARKARWREHYTKSVYYPVWTVVADRLKRAGVTSIVDIGCGPGQFACLMQDNGIQRYLGLDFSTLRLEHARRICPGYVFQVTDIFKSDVLATHDYDAVVMLEFLEHVDRDLDALGKIKPGTFVIATVPNFPDEGHVRFFETADAVRRRYENTMLELTVDTFRVDDGDKLFFLIEGRRR